MSVLGIEGGLLAVISISIMWIVASKAVSQRHRVFTILMIVPPGVIRALAAVPFNLEGAEEEHDEEENKPEEQDDGGGSRANGETSGHISDPENGTFGRRGVQTGGKINLVTNTSQVDTDKKPGVWAAFSRAMGSLAFWRTKTAPAAGKRQLKPSTAAVLWITWPFMAWSLFVIVINIIGYLDLRDMSGPIATLNIVQFVSVRTQRVQLFALRLISEQYWDPTYSFTTPAQPYGVPYAAKPTYHATVQRDYDLLRKEYDTMLLGNTAESVRNETSPHFALAKKGIIFSQGSDIMYKVKGCLAVDQNDCQAKDSPFYEDTINGLDQAAKHFFENVEALLLQPYDFINMSFSGQYLRYIHEVGNADIFGGMLQLKNVYVQDVKDVYASAMMVHTIAFAVCCCLGTVYLLFVVRPAFKRVSAESKRCAELLSHLPPEIDVEALLADALRTGKDGQGLSKDVAAKATMKLKGSFAVQPGADSTQSALSK